MYHRNFRDRYGFRHSPGPPYGSDTVQKMAIMRNDDDGAPAGIDDIFQPADSIDIQIIGWLIQQQNFGIGKQRLRQQHP